MFKGLRKSALALACLAQPALAADDPGEARFLQRYLCPVSGIVGRIRETPWKQDDEQNRFLILYLPSEPSVYAQCALYDGGSAAQCEAVSPFYRVEGQPFRLARVPAL